MDLGVLKQEYAQNKFENCFGVLYQKYKNVRRVRRDGNCFYRTFLFQLFEHLVLNDDKTQYNKLIDIVTKSKEDLMLNGYDEIVIEDFYDTLLDALKGLAEVTKDKVHEHLLKILCNAEEANYMIMYIRFLAALYLKKNAILYEAFCEGNVEAYCNREVE